MSLLSPFYAADHPALPDRLAQAFQGAVKFFTKKNLVPGENVIYVENFFQKTSIGGKILDLKDLQTYPLDNGQACLNSSAQNNLLRAFRVNSQDSRFDVKNDVSAGNNQMMDFIRHMIQAAHSKNSAVMLHALSVYKTYEGSCHVMVYKQTVAPDTQPETQIMYFDRDGVGMQDHNAGASLARLKRTIGL